MAKNSIYDYDATSGNNTDVQSVDISEGCAASGINNAIREVMADLKDVSTGAVNLRRQRLTGSTWTTSASTATPSVAPTPTATLRSTRMGRGPWSLTPVTFGRRYSDTGELLQSC